MGTGTRSRIGATLTYIDGWSAASNPTDLRSEAALNSVYIKMAMDKPANNETIKGSKLVILNT
jgi:hypothetical protein